MPPLPCPMALLPALCPAPSLIPTTLLPMPTSSGSAPACVPPAPCTPAVGHPLLLAPSGAMMPMQVDVAGLAGDAANVLEAACRGMDGVEAEGKDSDETDPGSRRLKRKQSNRESARRSRLRKQAEMADVCESVAELESGNAQLAEQVSALQQTATHIESSNRLLREMLSVVHDSAGVGAMQAVGCYSQPARLHPLMQQLAEVQAALAASRRAAAQAGAGAELE
ncbi:hypothetical protein QJQ45_025009, partial [Haematococcus lacustris]